MKFIAPATVADANKNLPRSIFVIIKFFCCYFSIEFAQFSVKTDLCIVILLLYSVMSATRVRAPERGCVSTHNVI